MNALPEAVKLPPRFERERKFLIIGSGQLPAGAIGVPSGRERLRVMDRWREAIAMAFDREARPLKIAWALQGMLFGSGESFAGDDWIGTAAAIPVKKVDDGLRLLEDAGAIIRAHRRRHDGTFQRVIFPAEAILQIAPPLPPVTGGDPCPRDPSERAPVTGGQNNYNPRTRARAQTPTPWDSAALDAERREARRLGKPVPNVFTDGG